MVATQGAALRRRLEQAFRASLSSVDPGARVRASLARPQVAALLQRRPLIVAAAGKVAVPMARAVSHLRVDGGLVVAPDPASLPNLPVVVGSHPTPSAASVEAGRALWALFASVPADGVVVALISGGASALVEVPADGLVLDDIVGAVRALSLRGAPVLDVNALRRGLSAIKGGRLALASAAPVVTIAISDVVGDELDMIGSGPTLGPWTAGEGRVAETTIDIGAHEANLRARARDVCRRHFARGGIPANAERHLEAQVATGTTTQRTGDIAVLAAGVATLRRAAAQAVRAVGFEPKDLPFDLVGEVGEVADRLANAAEHGSTRIGPGQVLIAGGEPTVALPTVSGWGGRAQHLALLLARKWIGRKDRAALVVGSDGVDGPGPEAPAGAYVDGSTWDAIYARGVDPVAAIDAFDAGTALHAAGALVVTGPTGVNHADLVLLAHP